MIDYLDKYRFSRDETNLAEVLSKLKGFGEFRGDLTVLTSQIQIAPNLAGNSNTYYFIELLADERRIKTEFGSSIVDPHGFVADLGRTRHRRSFHTFNYFLETMLESADGIFVDVTKTPSLGFRRVHWDMLVKSGDARKYVFEGREEVPNKELPMIDTEFYNSHSIILN